MILHVSTYFQFFSESLPIFYFYLHRFLRPESPRFLPRHLAKPLQENRKDCSRLFCRSAEFQSRIFFFSFPFFYSFPSNPSGRWVDCPWSRNVRGEIVERHVNVRPIPETGIDSFFKVLPDNSLNQRGIET